MKKKPYYLVWEAYGEAPSGELTTIVASKWLGWHRNRADARNRAHWDGPDLTASIRRRQPPPPFVPPRYPQQLTKRLGVEIGHAESLAALRSTVSNRLVAAGAVCEGDVPVDAPNVIRPQLWRL